MSVCARGPVGVLGDDAEIVIVFKFNAFFPRY